MRTVKLLIATLMLGLPAAVCAQTVRIENRYTLLNDGHKGVDPVLNKTGNLLAFSSSCGKLAVYDFSDRSVTAVGEADDMAFAPVFSNDGKKMMYKNTVYKSRLRYEGVKSFDLKKKELKEILPPERELKALRSYDNGLMLVRSNKMLKVTYGKATAKTPPYVWSDGVDLNICMNGKQKALNPVEGAAGYIWGALSPDETKILFTAVGRGTFICDLRGNIVAGLGFLDAPVWYGDEYVVGMNEKDDGDDIIFSEVMIKSIDGKVSERLSLSGQIALNPTAASEAGKVAYATKEGEIYVVELSITR